MIYLANYTTAQQVRFPDNGLAGSGDLAATLTVTSTVGRTKALEASVSLLHTDGDYFIIEITLPDGLTDGEYEYNLMTGDGSVLDSGLLQIGNIDRVEKQAAGGSFELIQCN